MDNFHSLDASHLEKDSNREKAVYKRRSSVFQSRASVFNDCVENEDAVHTTDVAERISKNLQTEAFNLEEYIISLRRERKQWIETLKQRKTERRDLARHKLRLEAQGQPLDLSVLTESEKAFVAARPNYQEICKSYKKLSEITVKLSMLRKIVYQLNGRFILRMEGKLQKATEKMIEASGS